jgi:hypothetical protein
VTRLIKNAFGRPFDWPTVRRVAPAGGEFGTKSNDDAGCSSNVELTQVLGLRGDRERAELERLRKAEQRFGIVERHLGGVLLRGFMG